MALETVTYIADLVQTNPLASDIKKFGDDHIRNLKVALQKSFDGFPGMVLCTGAEAQGVDENEYVLTLSESPSAYTTGVLFLFKATHTNTSTVTFKVSGLAAKSVLAFDGDSVKVGEIQNGMLCLFYYDGTNILNLAPVDKVDRSGDTYSGTHNFSGATVNLPQKVDTTSGTASNLSLTGVPTAPTASFGSSGVQVATLDFVNAVATNASLPGQTGFEGATLVTDGTNASWKRVTSAGYFLGQS